MPPSDKNEQESSDDGILRCEKNVGHQISDDDHWSARNKGCSTEGFSKMDKKIKKYSKHPTPPPKKNSKILIRSHNLTKSSPGLDLRSPVQKISD